MSHSLYKLPPPTAIPHTAILVAGMSEIYKGKHYLCKNGTFLPAKGGTGEISHERCVKWFRRFESTQEAEEWIADYRAKWPKSLFTVLQVEETDERLVSRQVVISYNKPPKAAASV